MPSGAAQICYRNTFTLMIAFDQAYICLPCCVKKGHLADWFATDCQQSVINRNQSA